jgi:hypothetical protein
VNHHRRKIKLCCALLVFLCSLSCTIGSHAQDLSPSQLISFEIQLGSLPAGSILLEGAALSPDGRQVAAAYFGRVSTSRPADIALSLEIWNVGTQEPIASKQMSASQENENNFDDERPIRSEGFVQYCNNGSGIMVADPHGTLYYLNSQTLDVLHATATNIGVDGTPERIFCAANSPRAVFAVHGTFLGRYANERYGNGLVRVYDLTSGTLLQEWDMTKSPYPFGDVAISPSGNEIAVSYVPTKVWGFEAKAVQNLELFDVNTGKVTLQVKTGHLPGRITFAGETRVATGDTLLPQPFVPHPKIKIWDSSNGKLIREFGDPKVGARRFVGASSDGNVIIGYIPKETLISARGGPWTRTLENRFRLWNVGTGQTIATSPPFPPIRNFTEQTASGYGGLDPSLQVSANGRAVIVFWKSPWDIYPIEVFSVAPASPLQLH